jgi:hypothetical protein
MPNLILSKDGLGRLVMMACFCAPALEGAEFFDGVGEEGWPVMEAARQRIEAIRKGDFTLRFVDAAGVPLSGDVDIRLARHDFLLGGSLHATLRLGPNHPAREEALSAFEELFNLARVGDNWGVMEPRRGEPLQWAHADPGVAWAEALALPMRYHCLIYNYHWGMPKWSYPIEGAEEWWPLIERRIAAVAELFGGRVGEFEVINEMLTSRGWAKENTPAFPPLSDPKNSARILQIARKHLPDALLMANEAGIATTAPTNRHFRAICKFYQKLLDLGAPLDAVGYQAHFHANDGMPFQEGHPVAGPGAFTMKRLEQGLDMLGALGKPVHITEFSPPSRERGIDGPQPGLTDEEIAAWTVNFHTLAFSKPYIGQIVHWYLIDGVGGKALDAGLVSPGGDKKPLYYALRKLWAEEWTTRFRSSPRDGTVSFRGFYGVYEIEADGFEKTRVSLASHDRPEIVTVRMREANR